MFIGIDIGIGIGIGIGIDISIGIGIGISIGIGINIGIDIDINIGTGICIEYRNDNRKGGSACTANSPSNRKFVGDSLLFPHCRTMGVHRRQITENKPRLNLLPFH